MESTIPKRYYSDNCVRFHNTAIFIYKSKFLYIGCEFYCLDTIISMYIDTNDSDVLVIVYEDNNYNLKTLKLNLVKYTTDYSNYDLYCWLYTTLIRKIPTS